MCVAEAGFAHSGNSGFSSEKAESGAESKPKVNRSNDVLFIVGNVADVFTILFLGKLEK